MKNLYSTARAVITLSCLFSGIAIAQTYQETIECVFNQGGVASESGCGIQAYSCPHTWTLTRSYTCSAVEVVKSECPAGYKSTRPVGKGSCTNLQGPLWVENVNFNSEQACLDFLSGDKDLNYPGLDEECTGKGSITTSYPCEKIPEPSITYDDNEAPIPLDYNSSIMNRYPNF